MFVVLAAVLASALAVCGTIFMARWRQEREIERRLKLRLQVLARSEL
jgi:hypothetical protein